MWVPHKSSNGSRWIAKDSVDGTTNSLTGPDRKATFKKSAKLGSIFHFPQPRRASARESTGVSIKSPVSSRDHALLQKRTLEPGMNPYERLRDQFEDKQSLGLPPDLVTATALLAIAHDFTSCNYALPIDTVIEIEAWYHYLIQRHSPFESIRKTDFEKKCSLLLKSMNAQITRMPQQGTSKFAADAIRP